MRKPIGQGALVTLAHVLQGVMLDQQGLVLEFLVLTQLIRRPQNPLQAVAALRVPLVLHDFQHRFQLLPQPGAVRLGGVGIGARVVHREHPPVADIGIVGNRENVAAGTAVETLLLENPPQFPLAVRIEVGDRPLQGDRIAKDHIAMQV